MQQKSTDFPPRTNMPKQWFPLESNPDVMNSYAQQLGLDISQYSFTDVMSTEDWAIEMVPSPVLAVLMLYPIKEVSETHRREENSRITTEGQTLSPNVYYMKQTVGNACGTVAILHAIGNSKEVVAIEPNTFLSKFYARTASLKPEEIAAVLEEDEEIEETHEAAASEGQSEQVARAEDVDNHFVCLSAVDGHLYELDGRKAFPINHGPILQGEGGESDGREVLRTACRVVSEFMQRDPEEMRFTIVALTKTPSE